MIKVGEIRRGKEIGGYGKGSDYQRFIWHACVGCGKERWVMLRKGKPSSLKCYSCGNKGNKSNWKGGRLISSAGYVFLFIEPDNFFYPMANKGATTTRGGRYIQEHRLVVAKALGRCLRRREIVHHKHAKYPAGSIEDKQDNRYPENLELVSDNRHNQITILEYRIKNLEDRLSKYEKV